MRFTIPSIIVIGRSDACDLRPTSLRVSRSHAVIALSSGGEVSLRDLDSVNGTWVNGERIEKTVVLKAGDKVTLGPVELRWSTAEDDNTVSIEAFSQN